MIVRLPLGEYRPDQTQASGFLQVCRNVFASGDGRYRPLRDIQEFTDALDEPFQGGFSAISSDGTGFLLAGTATDLYRLQSGSWSSLEDSLTVTQRWRFAQFGDYVIAVNGGDTYEVDLGAGTAGVLTNAPAGNSVATIGDYVMIGQPDGAISTVAWCAFRDHTEWTPGTDQAGEQPFQTGGAVQGVAGGDFGIILQRERIVRATRTGDALAPFQFDEVSTNFGCSNGATIAQAGRTVFFHSDRGFMALDNGQDLRPIGSEKVDRYFESIVGRDSFDRIYAAVDPQNKVVMWGVPGSPGLLLMYNFELDRWSDGSFPFTGLMAGFTTSTTLEALAATYTDLDAMTISLDDGRWTGGNPRLYFFDEDHKAGTLTGSTLAARFDLGFHELIPGQRVRIRGVRPSSDATSGMSVILDARQRLGDAQNSVQTSDLRGSGTMPIRATGRYVSTSLRFDAGTPWTYAQGIEVDCNPGGSR